MSTNPIPVNPGTAGQGGNVPQSFHPQATHPIQQHHQKAYEAAVAHAVQQQHAPNQQTPYVFINQVTEIHTEFINNLKARLTLSEGGERPEARMRSEGPMDDVRVSDFVASA